MASLLKPMKKTNKTKTSIMKNQTNPKEHQIIHLAKKVILRKTNEFQDKPKKTEGKLRHPLKNQQIPKENEQFH